MIRVPLEEDRPVDPPEATANPLCRALIDLYRHDVFMAAARLVLAALRYGKLGHLGDHGWTAPLDISVAIEERAFDLDAVVSRWDFFGFKPAFNMADPDQRLAAAALGFVTAHVCVLDDATRADATALLFEAALDRHVEGGR